MNNFLKMASSAAANEFVNFLNKSPSPYHGTYNHS